MAFRVRPLGKETDARKAKRLGFRSGGEMLMAGFLREKGVPFLYEERSLAIPYVIPASDHKYLPDFFLKKKDGTIMYIDYKGLWELDDRRKHLYIKREHPHLDIRIVFEKDPHKQYIGARGKSATYADICTEGKGRGEFKSFYIPYSWVQRDKSGVKQFIPAAWLKECEVK